MLKQRVVLVFAVVMGIMVISCKNTGSNSKFEVNGTVTNSKARVIYLEEVNMQTTVGVVVDSAVLDDSGKFKLESNPKEQNVFTLRLDKSEYPFASVINDASKITLDATFSGMQSQFADKYEIKNSPASEKMKQFMLDFNNELQKIYFISLRGDSLQKANAPDSVLLPLYNEHSMVVEKIKNLTLDAIANSDNPALAMFELRYYQDMAKNPTFGLKGFSNSEVATIVGGASRKYPDHAGLAAVNASLTQQLQSEQQEQVGSAWVGRSAPEISLPDVNGKEIKLSSYKGKYVLVDFWASWCTPCRYENPTVVNAYQKYKDKNFDILGVSLDHKKDAWLKAIKDDKLTWTHVSDLKGWESEVVPVYDFGQVGIPYNVLLDPDGKVIAERLRGAALEAKLAEVIR